MEAGPMQLDIETFKKKNELKDESKDGFADQPYYHPCPKCNKKYLVHYLNEGPHYGYIYCWRDGKSWAPKPEHDKKTKYKRNTNLIDEIPKERQHFCWWCLRDYEHLKSLKKRITLDVHHIIEVAKGGTDDSINLMVLCTECHKEVHRRREFWMSYKSLIDDRT